ncbi:iron-sulfur cluster assembly protein, partial [Devosia sp.]|uniref:iron-sulfur cluster assembly protein n=1 Tax=Devosia sp. TaxID=1871048 RepID=UPI0025E5EDB9
MADTELAARIKAALNAVEIPGGGDLASFSGLSEIIVTPSAVAFAVGVPQGMEAAFGPAREAAIEAVKTLSGTRKVMVSITSEKQAGPKFSHGSPSRRARPA